MKKSLALLLTIVMIVSVAFSSCTINNGPAETPAPTEVPELNFEEIAPKDGAVVALLEGETYEYFTNYSGACSSRKMNSAGADVYYPEAAHISWKFIQGDAKYYTVKLCQNESLEASKEYFTITNSIDIPDLFTGATYYYKIIAHTDSGDFESKIYNFQTENTIRTITIPNVSNTRDLGGWLTVNGTQRIKEGIVYRGATLDAVARKNKTVVTDYYGIKTEIDCREGVNKSPFKNIINVVNCYAPYYVGSTGINSSNKQYRNGLLKEIQTFADPENYPIYFHCQIGRDRTGTLAILILGLCGVSKADLYKDYEFSMFASVSHESNPQIVIANVDNMFAWLEKKYPAETTKETIEKFCLDLGVTAEEISAIRANMLENIPENLALDKKADYTPLKSITYSEIEQLPAEYTVKAGLIPCFEIEPDDGAGTIKTSWSGDGTFDGQKAFVAGTGDYVLTIKYKSKDKLTVKNCSITFHVVE